MAESIMSGRIEEVPIDSLIQIIVPGKKTGVLALSTKTKTSKIYFEQGDIVYVESTGYDRVKFLKNYLTNFKQMYSNNISEIKNFGEKYGYTFEQSLYTGKYLGKDEFNFLIKSYFEDLACEIFTMKRGEYKFTSTNSVLKVGTIKLESQFILMEAGRRIDVKPAIFEMFNNREKVFQIIDGNKLKKKLFKKKQNKSEDVALSDEIEALEIADSGADIPQFTTRISSNLNIGDEIKKHILKQINGIDNVEEIILYSGWSEFRILEFLKELYLENEIKHIGEKESSFKLENNVSYSTSEKVNFFSYALILSIISFIIFMINLLNINTPFLNIISIEYNKINYNQLVIESIEKFYNEKVDYANKIFYINNMRSSSSKEELFNNNYINRKEFNYSKDLNNE